MPILFIIHLFVGVLAGALFSVQTLLVLAVVVLVEAVCAATVTGVSSSVILWWAGAEVILQFGYLAGVYVRSVLERFGTGAHLHTSKRP